MTAAKRADSFQKLRYVVIVHAISVYQSRADSTIVFLCAPAHCILILRTVRSENHRARGRDDESFTARVFGELDGLPYVSALGSDARNEYRKIGDDATNTFQFIRIRRTNDERTVIICIPNFRDITGDFHIQRCSFGNKILEFSGPRIGSAAQDDDSFVGSFEKRCEGFSTYVRMHSNSIRSQIIERSDCISLISTVSYTHLTLPT